MFALMRMYFFPIIKMFLLLKYQDQYSLDKYFFLLFGRIKHDF